MRDFQIITDTNSDLPKEYVTEKGLLQVPQYTLLQGVTYEGAEGIDPADFYNKMKAGEEPQSQAINPAVTEEKFREALDAGKDVLYISFASTLSGSYNTAAMTAQNLSEEYPDAKIITIDTLAASVAEGLLVMKAVELKEEGKSIEEVSEWLENNKLHVAMTLTVDDLHHLQRGGRISKTTAIVGSILNIKPVMRMDNEGHLDAVKKVISRKKSIKTLCDDFVKTHSKSCTVCYISHADCLTDAQLLATEIENETGIKPVITDLGPIIGCHSGPGTLSLYYLADRR